MTRPIAALDCETTGTDPASDRIVELCVVRVAHGCAPAVRTWRINPGVPIPASATAVHGITDAEVAACPSFSDVAAEVAAALDGAVIVGHNVRAFDMPLIAAEFARAGLASPCEKAEAIDTLLLDRARTRHDLTSVVHRWCGRKHVGAHGAEADALAALDVLSQMARGASVDDLIAESNGNAATPCGRVLWREDGAAVWGFGKARGKPLNSDRGFARWVADKASFPADLRALAARGARGEDVRR